MEAIRVVEQNIKERRAVVYSSNVDDAQAVVRDRREDIGGIVADVGEKFDRALQRVRRGFEEGRRRLCVSEF